MKKLYKVKKLGKMPKKLKIFIFKIHKGAGISKKQLYGRSKFKK